jgi:hypothetical protein
LAYEFQGKRTTRDIYGKWETVIENSSRMEEPFRSFARRVYEQYIGNNFPMLEEVKEMYSTLMIHLAKVLEKNKAGV